MAAYKRDAREMRRRVIRLLSIEIVYDETDAHTFIRPADQKRSIRHVRVANVRDSLAGRDSAA